MIYAIDDENCCSDHDDRNSCDDGPFPFDIIEQGVVSMEWEEEEAKIATFEYKGN